MAQQFIHLSHRPLLWLRVVEGVLAPAIGLRQQIRIWSKAVQLLYRKRRKDQADRAYQKAHDSLLASIDPKTVTGLYIADPDRRENDILLSVFERSGRADIDLLRRVLPEAVAKLVIHPTTEVHIVIPGDRSRREEKIRKGFNSYASIYHGGFVNKFFVAEMADEAETRHVCKQRQVPFPEDAFPDTNVITFRHNPAYRPADR